LRALELLRNQSWRPCRENECSAGRELNLLSVLPHLQHIRTKACVTVILASSARDKDRSCMESVTVMLSSVPGLSSWISVMGQILLVMERLQVKTWRRIKFLWRLTTFSPILVKEDIQKNILAGREQRPNFFFFTVLA